MGFTKRNGSYVGHSCVSIVGDEALGKDQLVGVPRSDVHDGSELDHLPISTKCSLSESSFKRTRSSYHDLPGLTQFHLSSIELGTFTAPILCSLSCYEHLAMKGRCECISYSWEIDTPAGFGSYQIQANGHTISMQANLWFVLRRIRRATTTQTLWADAL